MSEMVRINTRVSSEVNNFLDERSKKTGVPKSTIVHIALEQYMQQLRSVSALELSQGTLKELYDKVTQIEEKLSSESVVKS